MEGPRLGTGRTPPRGTVWAAVLAGMGTEVVGLRPSHTRHVTWFLRLRWVTSRGLGASAPLGPPALAVPFCLGLGRSPHPHHLRPQVTNYTPIFQREGGILVETLL